MNAPIRPAAVAGSFYPADAGMLDRDLHHYLQEAETRVRNPQGGERWPKALVVPHAGYIYSGPVAASGYALLENGRGTVRRVILLGPAHRVPVRGLALPGARGFRTPLGVLRVDEDGAAAIAGLSQVRESQPAHALEHAIEVHLPFVQKVLGEVTVLPLVVGDASAAEVAEVLEQLWGGPETLIIVSSDLSHYLPYDIARSVDHGTARQILSLSPAPLAHEQACGATPINGLLMAARRHGLRPELLDLRNSGDTAGPRDGVVGYGAFAFFAPTDEVRS